MVLNIDPIMFRIGPLAVRWYGFLMGVSILIGAIILMRLARQRQMDEDTILNLLPITVISGLIGARIVYVATNWSFYVFDPSEIIRIDHGGLSFHGAVFGGLIAGLLYLRYKRIPWEPVADLFVPGLSIGIVLVRIGNLINGEAQGRITASGFQHPAQLYGSSIGLVLLIMTIVLWRKNPRPGVVFWNFALWYSVLRSIFEETFRDNPLYLWGYISTKYGIGLFTLTQIVSVPIIAVAAWRLWQLRQAPAKKPGHTRARM